MNASNATLQKNEEENESQNFRKVSLESQVALWSVNYGRIFTIYGRRWTVHIDHGPWAS